MLGCHRHYRPLWGARRSATRPRPPEAPGTEPRDVDRVGNPELPRCGLAGNLRERDTSRVAPVVGNRVSGAGTMPAESQIEGGRHSSRCGGATLCKGRSPPLRNIIRRLVSHPRCTLCQYPCANCSAREGRARAKARTAADGAWCCARTYGAGGQKFWGRHRDRWELRSHPSPPTGTGGVVPLSPQGHPNWGATSPAPPRDRAGAGPGGRPGRRARGVRPWLVVRHVTIFGCTGERPRATSR